MRNEFAAKCRHSNKFTVAALKTDKKIDLLTHTIDTEQANEPATNQKPVVRAGKLINLRKKRKLNLPLSPKLRTCTVQIEKLKINPEASQTIREKEIVATQYSKRGRQIKSNPKYYNEVWENSI